MGTGLPLEDRTGMVAGEGGEDRAGLEDRVEEDGLDVGPLSRPGNFEELSPPGHQGAMDDPGGDLAVARMVVVLPLEGSNAELRARVIKEVRKPGRSEYPRG